MLSASGTGDKSRKRVFCFRLWLCKKLRPSCHLQLHQVVGADIDDRLVSVLCVVLRKFSVVYQCAFCEVILTKFGLQQQIARICIVAEDSAYRTLMPGKALLRENPFFVKPFHNGGNAFAVKVVTKYGANHLCLFGDDDVFLTIVSVAHHKTAPGFSVLELLPYPPLLILAGGEAFLLSIACEDGQHQLTVRGCRMNILLFKVNIHTQVL